MSFVAGTPLWVSLNGLWRPAAVGPSSDETPANHILVVFTDETFVTVPVESVLPFDETDQMRTSQPEVQDELKAFLALVSTSAANAAGEGVGVAGDDIDGVAGDDDDDDSSSDSDDDDETEGQPTQPGNEQGDDDDDDAKKKKLDKKAKKALKKEKKKEKKDKKKEKKADKKSKKEKKGKDADEEENDEDLLGVVSETLAKDKKDKKKDKKKEKKSKKEKKEKRRREAEMSQTQDDDSSAEDEDEEDDELESQLKAASQDSPRRLRGGGGDANSQQQQRLYSQRNSNFEANTLTGPIIPPSSTDLVLQRASRSSHISMSLHDKFLTQPQLSSVSQQLTAIRSFYKSEVSKLAMGTLSAGTGMTQAFGQVMPISEVDYLRTAERLLTTRRNTLRALQCGQAQLITQLRASSNNDETDEYNTRILALKAAILKEASFDVVELFKAADEEAKHPSGPQTHAGIPNLRPVRFQRSDEQREDAHTRHHHFSYIDPICEPASDMRLKAVSTIPTVPSKVHAEEIHRRELESMLSNNMETSGGHGFDLGSMLPTRLKGTVDGVSSRQRGAQGLRSLLAGNTSARGDRSNVRIMTQWRAFRDFDVDLQKKRHHRQLEEYLTTNRVQDVLPPNATSQHFDFGRQRLDERAERHAEHVIGRVMSTQNLAAASGQLSMGALLGGLSSQLGGPNSTSTANLPASDLVRTLTQGGFSQLNITDFGVSRNLKAKQARFEAASSGLLTRAETQDDADVASVYSSVGMDSEKSVGLGGFNGGQISGAGLAPADFGFDVENTFKSQSMDPGYPELSEIQDVRHVKSVDLPSVGGSSEGIDSRASSWQEARDRTRTSGGNDGAQGGSSTATNTARNIIRDLLVNECRSVYGKVKAVLSEAKKRGAADLAVAGGGGAVPVVFSLQRLESLITCLGTAATLKLVISTLRDRIINTAEIQNTITAFYSENDSSTTIPAGVLIPQPTQVRIRGSVLSYLSRQYGIPEGGLHGMRLQRKGASSNGGAQQQTQQTADTAQSVGSRRPRQGAYAYDE